MTDATTTTVAAPATPAAPAAPQGGVSPPPVSFDWKSVGLDAETLSVVETKQWKAPQDAITSYRNLEKLVGVPPEQIIKLPKDMTPELMGDVWNRLGKPKTSAEYNLPIPEGGTKDFADMASQWFHKHNVPASMAQGITAEWNAHMADFETKQLADYNKSVEMDQIKIKTEWGANYDSNVAIAKQAATTFGMDATSLSKLEQAMGFAGTYRFLHNIGSKLGEAEFIAGGGKPGQFAGTSPESARAQIEMNKKDKSFSERFVSKDPVIRGEARAEMDRLHKIGYPG